MAGRVKFALALVVVVTLLAVADARASVEWRLHDKVSAERWNGLVTRSGCSTATVTKGSALRPAIYAFAQCLARQAKRGEAVDFFDAALRFRLTGETF